MVKIAKNLSRDAIGVYCGSSECMIIPLREAMPIETERSQWRAGSHLNIDFSFEELVDVDECGDPSYQTISEVVRPFLSNDMEIDFAYYPIRNAASELESTRITREGEIDGDYILSVFLIDGENAGHETGECNTLFLSGLYTTPILLPKVSMKDFEKSYWIVLDALLRDEPISLEKIKYWDRKNFSDAEAMEKENWRVGIPYSERVPYGTDRDYVLGMPVNNPTPERVTAVSKAMKPLHEQFEREDVQQGLVDAVTLMGGVQLFMNWKDITKPEAGRVPKGYRLSEWAIDALNEEHEAFLETLVRKGNERLEEFRLSEDVRGLKELVLDIE